MKIPKKPLPVPSNAIDAAESPAMEVVVAEIRANTNRKKSRSIAIDYYGKRGQIVCTHCGFGILAVLEVAHLDGKPTNDAVSNLAILCPNCHKMHDIGLIPTETIVLMRDQSKTVDWKIRMKDAGTKAAATRKIGTTKLKWKNAGLKAVETRKKNAAREVL